MTAESANDSHALLSNMSASSYLLYFPKKDFSRRYSPNIFTFDIKSYEMSDSKAADAIACCFLNDLLFESNECIYYTITVSKGHRQWNVKRRYNDFYRLHHSITRLIRNTATVKQDGTYKMPLLPSKTYQKRITDSVFLNGRLQLLLAYLHNLMMYLTDIGLLRNDCICDFLSIVEV